MASQFNDGSRRSFRPRAFMLAGSLTLASAAFAAEPAADVRFNRDIRPIMSDTCFKCHGPATQKAKLRFDIREEALKKTKHDVIPIVPGKPEQSEAIRRIFSDDKDDVMPPADSHKKLTKTQKDLFRRWVEQGAPYEKHWSFEPPIKAATPDVAAALRAAKPAPPDAALKDWPRNVIDSFVLDRLLREGLHPSPRADRPTLIRRVAFALTGLPPTIAEVDEFLADPTPDAYEKMVERYLASPRFGEEMARHWLDVARYGDTHGLHLDNERQMWAYRDWVIQAFNDNKPFDQFTIEQLAGDLLEEKGQEKGLGPGAKGQGEQKGLGPRAKGQGREKNPQSPSAPSALGPQPSALSPLVATGYLRCNVTTGEGGSIDAEWVFRNAVDRTATTVETWMGLTAGCAMCHNHKFDPISQKEFYSLYAFFLSAADPPLDGNALLTAPSIKLTTPQMEEQVAALDKQIAGKQKELDDAAAALAYTDPASAPRDPAKPEVKPFEVIWFDDEFPAGGRVFASPGHPTTYVTAKEGQVFSGKKALKRTDKGLTQDVVENTPPLDIPQDGRIFVHIDPKDLPKTLMIQYYKGNWLHRAVWGDYDAIPWGAANTTQRVLIGPLPEAGKWVKLEIDATKIGLNPGDQVTGFAFTQFGGTVYWDKSGVSGKSDPTADPRRSLLAWWKQQTGKDTAGAPADLNAVLKAGPDKKHTPEQAKKLRDYYLQNVCVDTKATLAPLAGALTALKQQRDAVANNVPGTFVFRDLPSPRQAFVMMRGQYDKPADKVEPDVPAVLPPLKKANPAGRATRLDLARWLVAPEHPLTARVQANRLWQQFFGTGIVKTSGDFGSQGEPPTHPELLDWLAVQFRDGGWNVKDVVRLMVNSAAFRQDSRVTPALLRHDPGNRLYARGPRFRLDAEQIRDNALYVSGLMNPAMGGRGAMVYQPPNIWEPVGFTGSNTANYRQDTGAALYRRSIYVFLKRTAPPPFMVNFDAPTREAFCAQRDRSNSPLQALQLMNDVQHFEAARALAQRMMTEAPGKTPGGATEQERIAFAYRTVLSRPPEPAEAAVVSGLLQKQLAKFRLNPEAAKKIIRNGESPPKAGLPEPELAAYTMTANLILNLDETLNRN